MENKKIIISICIVLVIIIMVASVTYALYSWHSTYGLNVSIQVNDHVTITFDGGTDITGTLIPDIFPNGAIVKTIGIKSDLPSSNNTFNLYLKINELPNDLKNSLFKWKLSDCHYVTANQACKSTIEEYGDFSTASMSEYTDANTGDLLLLEGESISFRYEQTLYLYLWIDGSVDNNISMSEKQVDFDLYATGTTGTLIERS